MLCSHNGTGDSHIQRFLCRGEYTYERGKPLEISTSLEIGNTTQGVATVKIEVFRKNFWSYERIYSKTVNITLKALGQSEQFNVCIPGYETEEFNPEQQLKMKVHVTLNEESVLRDTSWKVREG